jgi:hypothetical protein
MYVDVDMRVLSERSNLISYFTAFQRMALIEAADCTVAWYSLKTELLLVQ